MTRSDTEGERIPPDEVIRDLSSETDLVEDLRSGGEAEGAAIRELQRRHLPAVVAYAQLCTTSGAAGRRLAGEAFFRALEEAADGVDPSGTWRHHTLTHVRETALAWAADDRRRRLRPDFLAWAETADTTVRPKAPDAMVSAFYQLPERLRSALWYAVVDDEPHSEVATNLGTTPDTVPDLAAKAQLAMRDAYVREHLSRRGTAECRGFQRIVEAAAQARDGVRHPDLAAHLAHCTDCGVLLSRLTSMSASPRTVLAEGLLQWGGAGYTERVPVHGTAEPDPPEQPTPAGTDGREAPIEVLAAPVEVSKGSARTRHAHRSVPGRAGRAVGGIAVVVVVVAVAAVVAYDVLPESWDVSGLERPGPSRSASAPAPSATPSRPVGGTPSDGSAPAPGGEPLAPVPVGTPSQIVHVATGLCLDVENQVVDKRVNAVAAPCGPGQTQRWVFDTEGRLHNEADPDFCLKADGNAAGVGIRPCTSDDPEKRSRMTFVIGEDGAIHSKPRSDQVIVPVGTSTEDVLPLVLKGTSVAGDERWAAGPVAATGAPSPPSASAP